jgi:hypothetical protein
VISTLSRKRREMLDMMTRWYPKDTPFATCDRCSRKIVISMKMLVIELKLAYGVFYDPMVPQKLKNKFYMTAI